MPIHIPNRSIISVSGADSENFLQGLISNDISKVTPQHSIYAALLSPQGKFLFDLFIAKHGDTYLIDCESARAADLIKRLGIYKLRAAVDIKNLSEQFKCAVAIHDANNEFSGLNEPGKTMEFAGGLVYRDPRLADMGWRFILPATHATVSHGADEYHYHRASLSIPDGSADLPIDRAIILENGFNELNAIDWQKGCYVGQELTARTKYRGLVRKRLLPCIVTGGDLPGQTSPVTLHLPDGSAIEAGETRSVANFGANPPVILCLLRLEHLDKVGKWRAGDAAIEPQIPKWVQLPVQESAAGD